MPRETIQQYIVEVKWETVGKTAVLNDFVGVMAKLRTTIAEAKTAMSEFKKVQQYPTSEGVIKRVERMARAYKQIGGIRFGNLSKLTTTAANITAPPSKLLTGTFKMPELDAFAEGGDMGKRGGKIGKLFGRGAASLAGRAAVGEFGIVGELAVALGPMTLGIAAIGAILRKLLKVTERYANVTIAQVTNAQLAGLGSQALGFQALKEKTGIDIASDLGKWYAVSRRRGYDPMSRFQIRQMANQFVQHYQGQGYPNIANYLYTHATSGHLDIADMLKYTIRHSGRDVYGALTAEGMKPADAQRIANNPQRFLRELRMFKGTALPKDLQNKLLDLQLSEVSMQLELLKLEIPIMRQLVPLATKLLNVLTGLERFLHGGGSHLKKDFHQAVHQYGTGAIGATETMWELNAKGQHWLQHFWNKVANTLGEGGKAARNVSSTHDQSSFDKPHVTYI